METGNLIIGLSADCSDISRSQAHIHSGLRRKDEKVHIQATTQDLSPSLTCAISIAGIV